jgi:hypothetical protein
MFYERSDSLVGICKDVGSTSSRTVTLDLTQYDEKQEQDANEEGKKRKARPQSDSGATAATRKKQQRGPPTSPGTVATQ